MQIIYMGAVACVACCFAHVAAVLWDAACASRGEACHAAAAATCLDVPFLTTEVVKSLPAAGTTAPQHASPSACLCAGAAGAGVGEGRAATGALAAVDGGGGGSGLLSGIGSGARGFLPLRT